MTADRSRQFFLRPSLWMPRTATRAARRAADAISIEQTLHRYTEVTDTNSEFSWGDVFTDDAQLSIAPADASVRRRPVTLRGLSSISEAFASTKDMLPPQMHLLVIQSIHVDRNLARGSSYFLRLDAIDGGPQVGSFGSYEDELTRCPDGGWRIHDRQITIKASQPTPKRQDSHESTDSVLQTMITEREIRNVVLRYCRAIDRRDLDAVRECYHSDATDNHGAYIGDVEGFLRHLEVALGKCERTFHLMGNHLVEVDGDRARSEAYVLAFHRQTREGQPARDRTVALRYLDVFERRDGGWKISDRKCIAEWVRTDPVAPGWEFGPDYLRGRPGTNDPIYAPW